MKIPALNDSRYVGMSVYNVVILSVIGVPAALMIEHAQNATFALTAVFILFCTTVTLCLVFVPKVNTTHGVATNRDEMLNKASCYLTTGMEGIFTVLQLVVEMSVATNSFFYLKEKKNFFSWISVQSKKDQTNFCCVLKMPRRRNKVFNRNET